MITTLSHLIGLAEMAIKSQKTSRKTTARAASGKCLLCDTVAKRRGLCIKHYFQFRKHRSEQASKREQTAFEVTCIETGKILPLQEIRRIKSTSPFSEVS